MMMRGLLSISRRTGYRCYSSSPLFTSQGRLPRPPISYPGDEEKNRQNQIMVPRISLHPRYFSTSTGEKNGDTKEDVQTEPPKRSAKELIKVYGPVFIGTYLTVYAATLATLFTGVESGMLDPSTVLSMVNSDKETAKSTVEVIVEFMEHYPWTKPYAPVIEKHPEWANLGVAWVATKFTEPIRLAITVPLVPRVARAVGWAPPKKKKGSE